MVFDRRDLRSRITTRRPDPVRGPALRAAAIFCSALALLAVAAGGVRILPWIFDASVPWGVIGPFARAVATLALEAAVAVGWPLGWGLEVARIVDRGEGRVLALLGEAPERTAMRLVPQGLAFTLALGLVALAGGRDASAPGQLVSDLVARGRSSCQHAREPRVDTVPFLAASWICAGDRPARLVVVSPLGGRLLTAGNARITGDFRRIELDDVRFALGGSSEAVPSAKVRAGTLVLRGLPPFAHASAVPPALRALVVSAAALLAALSTVYWLLRVRIRRRLVGLLLGASGPLVALGALRFFERSDSTAWSTLLAVPVLAALAPALVAAVVLLARRRSGRPSLP